MRLGNGNNTKRWWTRPIFPVAGMTVVWLIGASLAVDRTQISASSATPSPSPAARTAVPSPLLSTVGSQVLAQAASQAGAAEKPRMSDELFTNIQALKGIPVEDFMLTMGIMTSSLGFDCSDCHDYAGTDKVNWAADTPRKRTARKMVLMEQAINKDNFGGRQVVTCFSCHRNRDRPLTTPTMDMMYGEPKVEPDDFLAQTEGAPKADVVLDKYLAALGGADKLNSLTSYVASATGTGFGGLGGAGQVSIYAKFPDKRSTIIQFKETAGRDDSARTFDGTGGWIRNPLSVLGEYEIHGTELDGARLDAQLGFPGQIKQVLKNWRVNEPFEHVRNRETYAVQGDGPRGIFATLYFDKETGLLVRSIRYGVTAIGRTPTQIDYDDYRDIGNGIKFPFSWIFAWPGGREVFTLSGVKPNVPIEDTRFGKPSVAKQ